MCSGFNTDYGSSEPLKTLVMLCYVRWEARPRIIILLNNYLILFSTPPACWRWDSYKAPSDLSLSGHFTIPVDAFFLQAFPDSVHTDIALPPSVSLSLHMSVQSWDWCFRSLSICSTSFLPLFLEPPALLLFFISNSFYSTPTCDSTRPAHHRHQHPSLVPFFSDSNFLSHTATKALAGRNRIWSCLIELID